MSEYGDEGNVQVATAEGGAPVRTGPESGEPTAESGARSAPDAQAAEPGETGPAAADQGPGGTASGRAASDVQSAEASSPEPSSPEAGASWEGDGSGSAAREPGEAGPAQADGEATPRTDGAAEPTAAAANEPAEAMNNPAEATPPTEAQAADGQATPAADAQAADAPAADADAGAQERAAQRQDVAAAHPELYRPVDAPPPQADGPHESPEQWAGEINPGRGIANCGDCARSVQQTWEGNPKAAALGGPEDTPYQQMRDWAGADLQSTSVDGINGKLAELGPGSSAIVGVDWEGGGGHWFNAVNDDGAVKAVDGQSGKVETWPPSESVMGYEPADMRSVEAIFFDANGRVVR